MTKKKINIVLIIIVLGLWGAVGYKTITQYFFSKDIIVNTDKTDYKLNMNLINKDTFLLGHISRDPFLDKQYQMTNPIAIKQYPQIAILKVSPKTVVSIPKEIINWPSISYHGFIKSNGKNQELILLKIDGKLFRVRKNDIVQKLTVKEVSNDSIEVIFNQEKRFFNLKRSK